MGLSNLWNPELQGWENFWFYNWIDHQTIQQAIQKKKNVNTTVWVITPWSNIDANGILQRHQQYHNDMNQQFGLNGEDLSTIDFKNPKSVADWAFQHYNEHQAVHAALGS